MNDALVTTLLVVALFALLGSGVWIGLALAGAIALSLRAILKLRESAASRRS